MKLRFTLLLSPLLIATMAIGQSTRDEIHPEDIMKHVRFLASDDLEGRLSGSEGNTRAAEYIANEFKRMGLLPGGDNNTYFQTFDFVSSMKLGENNQLVIQGNRGDDRTMLDPEDDFIPFSFSTNESVRGPVSFVGYGISVPEKGYDDYEGIDVSGRIVIAMRYTPEGNDPHGGLYEAGTFRNKARLARENGALGLIIVNGPADDPDDDLVRLRYDKSFATSGIPVASMKRWPLEQMLEAHRTTLEAIQDSIDTQTRPSSFPLKGYEILLTCDVIKVSATTSNIIGYINGTDPNSEAEGIVIGAHMDHLGYGGRGSGSTQPYADEIHNGADDNASGTAGILELAEEMASRASAPDRTAIFIAFSAEELGTLGSAYYVRNPFLSSDKTVSMINLDMIGRLEDDQLTVYGTGTSAEWDSILQYHNQNARFELSMVEDGYGPSDHSQFYSEKIPVLFFFTGEHEDYHKPSDDWEKLNYEGEARILRLVSAIAQDLVQKDSRVTFKQTSSGSGSTTSGVRSFRVTLGVIPDYSSESEGMKIGGVRPDGPAAQAGLEAGDTIIGMNKKKILNIYDYMAVLGELRPGDVVDVEVERGSQRLVLEATMKKPKR